jgi:hypothetical protein
MFSPAGASGCSRAPPPRRSRAAASVYPEPVHVVQPARQSNSRAAEPKAAFSAAVRVEREPWSDPSLVVGAGSHAVRDVDDPALCFLIARSRDSPPPMWVDIPTGGVSRLPRQRQAGPAAAHPNRLSFCANGPKHHPVLGTRRRLPPAVLSIDHGRRDLHPVPHWHGACFTGSRQDIMFQTYYFDRGSTP